MIYFTDFIKKNPVSKDLLTNKDAEKTFIFLKTAPVIVIEIIFSRQNLPVVSGIAKDLEARCEKTEFPMIDQNNRKIVGRMIRYILDFYGYTPKKVTESEKYIRNFSDAAHFKTSQVYHKTQKPKLVKRDLVIQLLEQL